jgi:alkanesulfonate monooxygenase SsuD/methylene tetrahydromethanopterin reductase-like flavin-dependent oxidoreductase (luciferase family)
MKYAVHLPNFGAYGDARVLADLAHVAEAAGWDGFFLWDHNLFAEPDKLPYADPWVALTAAALNTRNIKLGTLVTPIPRRRPWKLARETVTLHNLSGGRLILGVGIGDPVKWEYDFFHAESDPKIRAAKLDEGLAILKGLWSGQPFSFQGEHFQLEEMTFLPPPVTPIPIWVGGFWPKHKRPFRRAARHDGVVPAADGPFTPDQLREMMAYIAQHRTDTSAFDVVIGGVTNPEKSDPRLLLEALAEAGATWWLEDLSPLRFEDFGWEDMHKQWNLPALRARIEAGPPKL